VRARKRTELFSVTSQLGERAEVGKLVVKDKSKLINALLTTPNGVIIKLSLLFIGHGVVTSSRCVGSRRSLLAEVALADKICIVLELSYLPKTRQARDAGETNNVKTMHGRNSWKPRGGAR
jgi:hypothetical protein